ncbi:MAG: anthranilate phosphoribosyltransferase [Chloroflexota bacterium]
MAIREAIGKLVDGAGLDEAEAAAAMTDVVQGTASPAQIGAFATALRMKGESVDEIVGLARVMRQHARRVSLAVPSLDIVGTGGDNSNTLNISTLSALVVAAAGGRIAKHGNRAITSGCGSADILEALEVAIDLGPEDVARCVEATGFGFMFAPAYHPAMTHAAAPRRDIGIRTIFNVLGPLTNPANASHLLIGVAAAPLALTMARALARLGAARALVVHGFEGVDELSIGGPSLVVELADGAIRQYELRPDHAGLRGAPLSAIQGGSVAANLGLATDVLAGKEGPARDVVLLNAGAALYVAGLARTIAGGVALAGEVVASGRARAKLDEVRRMSRALRARRESAA